MFRDLTVSLSGRNLICWNNYRATIGGEFGGSEYAAARSIDFGSVPIPRTYKTWNHHQPLTLKIETV